ncbi:MAG: exodeoxyribonuclease III [Lactobacillales bacterium]|jgi:exodeoxyribonuclease-3|nr:exodeoxyribonuclease III [Lactobacillales bacterium]
MQKIISWNVAGIRSRMDLLLALLHEERPDYVFLQEIKADENTFPFFELQMAGYESAIAGQKSYNGVAILSPKRLHNVITALPGFPETPDPQARFIQAQTDTGLTLINIYAPNGNPPMNAPGDTSRLTYKIKWYDALIAHLSGLVRADAKIVLGGDFNVIEKDTDVYNPDLYRHNAVMVPAIRDKFAQVCGLGLINCIRAFHPAPHTYSFWDFTGGCWPKNNGMLLDYFLVSPNLSKRLRNAGIHKEWRGREKPSDHVPLFCLIS